MSDDRSDLESRLKAVSDIEDGIITIDARGVINSFSQGAERRILEAGCDGYVAKPIASKEFLAEVERLLVGGPA